ncbi:MAG: hypothetical protein AAFQ82_27245, partial [Myxococcota bacterium]
GRSPVSGISAPGNSRALSEAKVIEGVVGLQPQLEGAAAALGVEKPYRKPNMTSLSDAYKAFQTEAHAYKREPSPERLQELLHLNRETRRLAPHS